MEDERILELFWHREHEAISETARKYGAYCLSIARNILHSDEDAEECVNDAYLRLWNAIPPQRPASLKLFLARVTRNLAFDRYEARNAEKRGGGELPLVLDELAECLPDESDVEKAFEQEELGRRIRLFVRRLPPPEGDVFVRRYFFAEAPKEIASRYGMTPNHVAVMLNRTRKKLRTHLLKEGFYEKK